MEEKLQPKMEEVFGECFVKVTFTFVGQACDYYEGVTIEEYYKLYEDVYPYIQIFVNMEGQDYSKEESMQEFEILSQLYDMEFIEGAGCRCYFLNKESMSACREYFKEDSCERGGSEVFENLQYFGFGFNEGIINKTFEEYDEVRKEINTNE